MKRIDLREPGHYEIGHLFEPNIGVNDSERPAWVRVNENLWGLKAASLIIEGEYNKIFGIGISGGKNYVPPKGKLLHVIGSIEADKEGLYGFTNNIMIGNHLVYTDPIEGIFADPRKINYVDDAVRVKRKGEIKWGDRFRIK